MLATKLRGKRVLVLGLGLHGGGVSVVRWLVRQGARVSVSDPKSKQELAPSLAKLESLPVSFYLAHQPPVRLLSRFDVIIQNPAVPRNLPFLRAARKKGLAIENEASLFLKFSPSQQLIGVTGSKGKSTTSALLAAMLRRAYPQAVVAGNIRDTLMLDVLPKLKPQTPVVLELSSWHLELVGEHKLKFPLAVITNLLPDHLNRYASFAAYARAKANIFRFQTMRDTLVLNYDNRVMRQFGAQARAQVYWFSTRHKVPRGTWVRDGNVCWREGKSEVRLFQVTDLGLLGEHNLANSLAAATAAYLFGVSPQAIRLAVRHFVGLHDRLEFVRTLRGVRYVNDTTATAPVATQAALRALKGERVVLIAGGQDKCLSYRELALAIRRYALAVILLPGTATVKLQRALKGYPKQLLAFNLTEAVRLASLVAPPRGIVLLSPAAASFGLFRHEFDRGQQFVRAVFKLKV